MKNKRIKKITRSAMRVCEARRPPMVDLVGRVDFEDIQFFHANIAMPSLHYTALSMDDAIRGQWRRLNDY